MAEEYGASGNMWDLSSSRNRFESGASSTSSSGLTSIGSFGWLTDMGDLKPRSSTDHSSPNISISSSGSGVSPAGFHHHQLDAHSKLSLGAESSSSSNLGAETNLHMMNLGLSSQAMDWNQQQPLLLGRRGEKAADGSFRSMLQDNINSSANFQEDAGMGTVQVQWRSENYMSHGMLGSSESQNQHSGFEARPVNNSYQSYVTADYGLATNDHHPDHQFMPSNWSKVPQFLRNSPRKQMPQSQTGQLHFSNNAPFWNATSGSTATTDVRPSFFPSVQAQFPSASFEEKPKSSLEIGDSATTTKKSGGEGGNKRQRSETTQSSLPSFKVRKEKMGDRITALQQLVSPFGKTDTASVLSEAIEYIKFLHQQVSALSSPYMKAGAIQHHHHHHQNPDQPKLDPEGPRQDMRSRGLCLVPLSSTFHVTSHETNLDFWNPTFGGTFR